MNIHPISGWLRIVFNILLCIAILFVCLACFLDCVINKTGISLRFILYIVLIFGVKFLMESCLLALNKYSGNYAWKFGCRDSDSIFVTEYC